MGTIRLELQKGKTNKKGKAPIRIIYQLHGGYKYYNTGIKTYSDNWDDKKQQAVYLKKGLLLDLDVKKLNKKLSDLISDIGKIENRFEANGVTYSPEMVVNEMRGKDPATKRDASSKEVFSFIDRYIENNKKKREPGSLSVYRSLKSHLQDYEQKAKAKVTFDKINYEFFEGFQNFLISKGTLNNITIAKQLSTLKTFLSYARKSGIEVSTKYQSFTIKREHDLEVIALTRKEFETLYNLDLSKRPAWAQVRDVFCFSCATGLRYSDLKQLERVHIKEGVIDLTAIKTTHKTIIPLNPFSKAILKKYEKDPLPLPVISNQRSNEHLAKICDWAGIDTVVEIVRKYGNKRVATKYPKHELVRMHCGRKTFASLSIEAGMSAERVMSMGGWKDYKSFKRYMNLTNESNKAAMELAWGAKIIKSKLKAV